MSITRRPPPTLMVETDWSQPFVNFLALVLQKDQSLRPSAAECLEHPFLADADGLHECEPHPLVFAVELNARYKASKAAKAAKKAASKAASDAAAAAADGGDACCPGGHSLILYTTTSIDGAGTCDGCDRDIAHGTKVMDCRQCNYYLCDLCGAGRTEDTEGKPMGSSGIIGETKEGRTTGTDGEEGVGREGGDDGGNTSDTSDDGEDNAFASGTLTRQNSAELHEFDDMFGNGNTQMFATDWTLSDAPSGNAAADFAAAEEGAEMVAGGDADDARADSDNEDESFDSAGGTISVAAAAIEKVIGGGYVDSSALNGAVGFLGDTEYDGKKSVKDRGTHGKEAAATATVAEVRSPSAAGEHTTCPGVGGGAPSMLVHAVLKGKSYTMNRVDMDAKRDMLRELFQRNAHAAGTDTDTSTCRESFFGSEDGSNARVKGGAGAAVSPVRSSAVAEGVDEEEDDMESPFTRAPRRGLLRKLVQRSAANFMAVCENSGKDKSEENAEASGVVGAAIAARRTKVRFATDDDVEAKVRTAEALAEMNAVLCSRPLISYPRRRKGILKGGASVEETSEDQYDDFEAAWKAQQEEDARRTAAMEGERFVREARAEAAVVEAAAVAKAKAIRAEAAAVATAKAAEEEAEAAILAKAVAAEAKAAASAAAEAAIMQADDLARREAAASEAAAATAAAAAVLVADPPLECSSGVDESGGEGCDYVEGTAAVHVDAVESEKASECHDVRVGSSNKKYGDGRGGDDHGAVFCEITNRTCGHHHGESGSRGASTGSNAGGLLRKRRLGIPARKRRGPVVDASALLLRVRALVSVDGGGADGKQRGGAAVGGGQLVGQQGGWPEAMVSAETRFASRCGGGACGLCCAVHGRRSGGNGSGGGHGGAKRKGHRNSSNAVYKT